MPNQSPTSHHFTVEYSKSEIRKLRELETEIAEKILANDINRRITDLEELIKLRLQSIDAHAQDHTRRLATLERANTPPGESITYTRTIDGGKIRTWNTRAFNSGRRKGMVGRRVGDIKKPNYGP